MINDQTLKEAYERWIATFPPLTPWFPGTQPPARAGVYMVDQARLSDVPQCVFSLWSGRHWYIQGSTPKDALKWICYGPNKREYFRQWRGLMEETK